MSQDVSSARGPLTLAAAREWPVVMLVGVLTIVLGGIVIAWPSETLVVLSVLFGIQLLIFGLFRLINAFAPDNPARGLSGFVGVLAMIAGIVVVRNPFETVEVLAVILGVNWIITGAIDVIEAISDSSLPNRGWTGFAGALSLVAGIVVVAWPAPTLTVIAWIGGFYLIVFGIMLCASAWQLRRLSKP